MSEIEKAILNLKIELQNGTDLYRTSTTAIKALEKQIELNELISDIKKDFNPKDSYSTRLVLEVLESLKSEEL